MRVEYKTTDTESKEICLHTYLFVKVPFASLDS